MCSRDKAPAGNGRPVEREKWYTSLAGRRPRSIRPQPKSLPAGQPGLVDMFSQLVNHYSAKLVDQ
jgi:hypothetical protein